MKGVLHLPIAFSGIVGVLLAIRFYRQKALAPLGILALARRRSWRSGSPACP